jgi:hypothetical protein
MSKPVSLSVDIVEWLIGLSFNQQNQKETQIMSALSDLDTKLQTLSDALTQLGTDVQAAFDALTAKIDAGADTTKEQATVQALIDKLTALDTAAKAIVTPTPAA